MLLASPLIGHCQPLQIQTRRASPFFWANQLKTLGMIGGGTPSHPSNSWDEAREGLFARQEDRRRRRVRILRTNAFTPLSSQRKPRVELHPEFDGWRL